MRELQEDKKDRDIWGQKKTRDTRGDKTEIQDDTGREIQEETKKRYRMIQDTDTRGDKTEVKDDTRHRYKRR